MKTQRLALALTVVNLILMALVFSPLRPTFAQPGPESIAPGLRGRSLEIVDERGRTRAQILIAPPTTLNGVRYPETVLLRLIDSAGQPTIKMAASVEGSGLNLLGGPDDGGWYGLQLSADGKASRIELVEKDGRRAVIRP